MVTMGSAPSALGLTTASVPTLFPCRQARGGPLVTAEQLAQLVSSQEDLRVLVRSLGRDLQELRDQAKQQQAAAAPAAASTG